MPHVLDLFHAVMFQKYKDPGDEFQMPRIPTWSVESS